MENLAWYFHLIFFFGGKLFMSWKFYKKLENILVKLISLFNLKKNLFVNLFSYSGYLWPDSVFCGGGTCFWNSPGMLLFPGGLYWITTTYWSLFFIFAIPTPISVVPFHNIWVKCLAPTKEKKKVIRWYFDLPSKNLFIIWEEIRKIPDTEACVRQNY